MVTKIKKRPYVETLAISDGQFSNENLVSVQDYKEGVHYGFFEKRMIKNGMLEVVIIKEDNDLACISPANGQPFDISDRRCITVRKDQITY